MRKKLIGPQFIMIEDIDGSINFHDTENNFYFTYDGEDFEIKVGFIENIYRNYTVSEKEFERVKSLLISLSTPLIEVVE